MADRIGPRLDRKQPLVFRDTEGVVGSAGVEAQPAMTAQFDDVEERPLDRMGERAVDLTGFGFEDVFLEAQVQQRLDGPGSEPEHRPGRQFQQRLG
ncbi:MAG: hypothetical protein PGN34_20620 [Methylobacterium frigidaeris]